MSQASATETTAVENRKSKSAWKEVRDWAKVIFFALLIAFAVTSVAKPTLVIGDSMYPTLKNHNYLVVNRLSYLDSTPHYKDIIVFHSNLPDHRVLVKRVIGTPGDKLQINNGKVYLNGKLLNEPYVHGQMTLGNIDMIIPKNKYFVMGDNRGNSEDSRFQEVGLVDKSQIIGKVAFRLIPPDPIQNK